MASNNDDKKANEKANFPRARDWIPSFDDVCPDWAKDSEWSSTISTLLTVVFGTNITEQQQVIFKPKIEALAKEVYVEWFETGHPFIGLEFVKYQVLAWYWLELGHTQEELDAMNLAIPISYPRDADLGYVEFLMAEHPDFYQANKWRMPVFRPAVKSGLFASNAAKSAPASKTAKSALTLALISAASYAPKAVNLAPTFTPKTMNSPASKAVTPTTSTAASKAANSMTSTAASKAAFLHPPIGPKQANQSQLNISTAQPQSRVSGIDRMIEAGRPDREEHFMSCGLSEEALEDDGYPFEARLPNNVHEDKAMANRLFRDPSIMRQVSTMLDPRLRVVWTEHHGATFLLAITTSRNTKLTDVDYLSVWEILINYCGMLETSPDSFTPLSECFRHSLRANHLSIAEQAAFKLAERKRKRAELKSRKQEDAAKGDTNKRSRLGSNDDLGTSQAKKSRKNDTVDSV